MRNRSKGKLGTWDWQVFCKDTIEGEVMPRCFGSGGDITYLDWMLSAWGWTLSVALLSLVVALVFGSLMGILRTTPNRGLVLLGNAWTELFRNIPLLVQIVLWYHVVPALVPPLQGRSQLPPGRDGSGPVHLGAHFRTGARRHPVTAERPAHGRAGASASRCRRPIATSCCRWRSASSFRR